MVSPDNNLELAKAGCGPSPLWSVHIRPKTMPERKTQNLHFKGFRGGVPLNTETTAMKPRVGIY